MTFGQKLKQARAKQNMTQEKLSQILCVSRQAVTKWELDGGMPDIENLKAISYALDVSIDSLLSSDESTQHPVMREVIDIGRYESPHGINALKEDSVVKGKFPNAKCIVELHRKLFVTGAKRVVDYVLSPYREIYDRLINPRSIFYLVEEKGCCFLVSIAKDVITTQKLMQPFTEDSIVIGEYELTKTLRKVI